MNQIFSKLPVAIVFAAACTLSTGAFAQSDSKRALAVKLAQLQQKADSPAMTEQLLNSAVQPLLVSWSRRVDETVPPARQKDVRDKLTAELKKYTDSTQKAIEAQLSKTAEAALVPVFMEKLAEDDMKTIIAYMESPAAAKFQALGIDAGNAWAQRIIDATKNSVENSAKTFEAAADRIVNSAVGSSSPSGSGASKK